MIVGLSVFNQEKDKFYHRYDIDFNHIPLPGDHIVLDIRGKQRVFYVHEVNHYATAFDENSKHEIQLMASDMGTAEEYNSHKRDWEWKAKKKDLSKPTKEGWQNTIGKRQVLKYMLENYSMPYGNWCELSEYARREMYLQLKENFDWIEYDWFIFLAKEAYERITLEPGIDIYKYYDI